MAFLINATTVINDAANSFSNIYYDNNNTGYYLNPNGVMQLNQVYADDWFRPQGDTGLYFETYGYGLWSPHAGGNSYGNVTTYGTGRSGWTGWGFYSRFAWMTDGGTMGLYDSSLGWVWRWVPDSYFIVDRGYSQFVNSARSPIFYDSDDTNSHFAGEALIMRSASPTIYLRDTDHNSAIISCNENILYILRAGNDSTSAAQVNSQWPFYFFLSDNNATCGGSFSAVGNVTAYSSDCRLKINIKNITNALDKVQSLNGVTFDWISKVEELGFMPDTMFNDVGVIAQEVQKVLPQAIKPAPFDREWIVEENKTKSRSGEDYLTVQYEKIVPLLIEAIRELKIKINVLKQRG